MKGREMENDLYKQLIEKKIKINEAEVSDEVQNVKNEFSTLPKEMKARWLLQAIKHLDLTSLGPDDSTETIRNLCLKATNPIEIKDTSDPIHTAAICIYPTKVKDAVEIFKQENISGIKIASVGAGFPTGKFPLEERLDEIKEAVKSGADEIDIVIDRDLVAKCDWENLLSQFKAMKEACGKATMKSILSTGELGSMENVHIVSMLAMIANSDFIKTSTGKEAVNATLPVGVVMCKAIKEFYEKTGKKVGFKPAGGIKTAEDVINWFILIKNILGEEWLTPNLFRIGASSVLDEIVKTYNAFTLKAD